MKKTAFEGVVFATLAATVLPVAAQTGETSPKIVNLRQTVQRNIDGVTVSLASGTLRLRVYSDRVIRVSYQLPQASAPAPSLAVIAKPIQSGWRIIESPGEVRLKTKLIEARVNRRTGAVAFFDANGQPVLAEKTGGRQFTPAVVGGQNTLRSRQDFILAPGEAIFGLGQHQNGDMNYRGKSVHLQQRNMDVGVPVLLSSRGYGVLWDNPAVTDVNVGTEPGEVIPSTQLSTESGVPGGLTGRYFRGQNFEEPVAATIAPKVDFNWTTTPPAGLPHDGYSVRWTGFVTAAQAGDYRFAVSSDDGVRLWIDDKPVIEDWSSRALKINSASVNFAAQSRHSIRLEYYQDRFDAEVKLTWQKPGQSDALSWTSEAADSIDYYFLYGPNLDDSIRGYRELTGAAPLFSKWSWGLWQSKERYQSQQELMDIVGEYRKRKIPFDGIIQDWQYWSPNPWGSHIFDPKRYPDPKKMMQDLHNENVHLLISVWPKFDVDSPNANELRAAGALYPAVIPYVYPPGKGQWYDPFNPKARAVYWRQMKDQLYSAGVDGWWLDASEAELSGKWGEFRDFETGAGSGARVYNTYPLMHSTAVYQGQRAETSEKRVYILTRSGYAGQQRNATTVWSGDIAGTWDVFAKQVPAGINFTLSGIPYWNTDTGGFGGGDPATAAYSELFTRWFQFSSFCPMLRIHGTNKAKEFWRFGDDTQAVLLKYDQLRYHLLPYIYSTSWKVTNEGYSMMRGLVLDFRNDPRVYGIPDQYMFGPGLMACPVTRPGVKTRPVYLPAGTTWTDFWTGQSYPGGQTIEAAAPIETMPLFVRAGSIIPYGPDVQYAMEKSDPIELRIYPGADGTFTLYEDDGVSYAYEKGAYATIPLTWNQKTATLTIGQRHGTFPGLVKTRHFRIVRVKPGQGTGIPSSPTLTKEVLFHGQSMTVPIP